MGLSSRVLQVLAVPYHPCYVVATVGIATVGKAKRDGAGSEATRLYTCRYQMRLTTYLRLGYKGNNTPCGPMPKAKLQIALP